MDVYGGTRVADAYAFHRPPVHAPLLRHLPPGFRAGRALDIGCGAGLSTAALRPYADQLVGVEASPGMLRHRRTVAPFAGFAAGTAEHLPFREHSFDLVAATGVLNYVDIDAVLPELARVLTADGTVVVYDFGEGGHDRLADWRAEFERRWPWPPGWRPFDPRQVNLGAHGWNLRHYTDVHLHIPTDRPTYLRYALADLNVDAAIRDGRATLAEIRDWAEPTLAEVFDAAELDVGYRGYLAIIDRCLN
ncbi:class I SAM-dependent methyltransferase [Hamadaea tsunoensis]|uniref:class I SAM-dependent methyltransferase n=1 Tax=Hamadaea tsunoensis TaxID=53368 RepID=UPI0004167845|nr:class I SAM-dependent methyltransferase [Hamadaea tsunoensis]